MRSLLRYAVAAGLLLSLAGCEDSSHKIADAVARAQKFEADGDLTKARIEYENALKPNPLDPKINLALAKLQDDAGDVAGAMPHYLRAASMDARLIEAQLRVVEILIDSGRLSDALGRINAAIGSFPKNADALALRADIEQRQSDEAAARTDADAAKRLDPANTRALAVLSLLQLKDGNGGSALKTVEQGLERAPGNLRLLQVRAAILLTLDQPDKAIEAFQAIVRAAPRNVIAYRVVADLEAKEGHLDKAIDNFQKAVEANSDDQDMQLGFISFLDSQGKAGAALDRLKALVAGNPKTETYDLILAEYYRVHNDPAAVTNVLAQAAERLKDTPSGLAVKVALAKVDVAAGRTQDAENRLASILSIDPQNRDALIVRASLRMKERSYGGAIADLLNVVKSHPLDGPAFEMMSAVYMQTGQKPNAIDAMRRAVAVMPGNDSAELKLAVFLQSASAVDAAKEILARVTLRQPTSVDAWTVAARLATERQDWASASRALARLRELNASQAATAVDAQLKLAQGDIAGAFARYRDIMDSEVPVDTSVLAGFARAAVSTGHIDDGIALLVKRAPSVKDESLQVLWTLVMTMQADAKHFEKASDAFKMAAAVIPNSVSPYSTFATILIAQKAYDKAREVVKQGLTSGADKSSLLVVEGSIDQAQGRDPAALANYRSALDENPSSIDALNNYASLLADLKPKDKAALTEARNRLVGKENWKNPDLIDTIAWLDYRLGRFDQAKLLLDGIGAAESRSPQIRFHLAAVLLATGDKAKGLSLLESVKGLIYPGSQEASALTEG